MGSGYEVTLESAKYLAIVNCRNGKVEVYGVAWIDDGPKVATEVDVDNGKDPIGVDKKLVIPFPPSSRLREAKLYIGVVHVNDTGGVCVGYTKLYLHEVVDDGGIGGKVIKTLELEGPLGGHGKIEVKISVKEPHRYSGGDGEQYSGHSQSNAPPHYMGYGQVHNAPPPYVGYGQVHNAPPHYVSYGQVHNAPPHYSGYGQVHNAPPQPGNWYPAAAQPASYPYGGLPQPAYGSSQYAGAPAYGPGSNNSSRSGAIRAFMLRIGGYALADWFNENILDGADY